jgi:hypothetical protein
MIRLVAVSLSVHDALVWSDCDRLVWVDRSSVFCGFVIYMKRNHEVALVCAVISHMLSDLQDRGVFSASTIKLWREKFLCGDDALVFQWVTKTLPAIGKAFEAFLLTETLPMANQLAAFDALQAESAGVFDDLLVGLRQTDCISWQDLSPERTRILRELAYLFYKYELPFDPETVDKAVSGFIATDTEIESFACEEETLTKLGGFIHRWFDKFDPLDIIPRHGPGAVSNREIAMAKYNWASLPTNMIEVYDFTYFTAGLTHLQESMVSLLLSSDEPVGARLIAVPKDSRGPRLISCEPKEHQWLQQGIMKKIVDYIQSHPTSRGRVNFDDQTINGKLALASSKDGRMATLDLKDASDRVPLALVERVFPPHVVRAFLACRSSFTELPSKLRHNMRKFAPMGSGLCFPVLAIIAYAVLRVNGVADCYVYGDDIVVPVRQTDLAIKALESVNFKVNLSKSCSSGFFRESCGVDAYKGYDVTPLRFKKRWRVTPSPDTYLAWVAYCNSLSFRGFPKAADYVAVELARIYGPIYAQRCESKPCFPALCFVANIAQPERRYNRKLQRFEVFVTTVHGKRRRVVRKDGNDILNFFTKSGDRPEPLTDFWRFLDQETKTGSVSEYTSARDMFVTQEWVPLYNARD